jgi:tRNA(fMet)-specific endonuclease VapC
VIFALDTNTLIYFFKGIGQVGEHLLNTPPSDIAIPTVVLYELEVGIAKSSSSGRRRAKLDELIEVVSLLPLGRNEAHAAAAVRADLERFGKPIGPLDTLIAGTALANHVTLVTHNTREFGRVPNLEIVDWF